MGGKHGSVVLFLRNLPDNVSRRDLKHFVKTELRHAGVRGTPFFQLCSSCSILRVTDPATGSHEYHGLIEVQPARITLQAIEALNGKPLAGKPIEVLRRYRQRSSWRDRHIRLSEDGNHGTECSRPHERRRQNLKMELVDSTPRHPSFGEIPALT